MSAQLKWLSKYLPKWSPSSKMDILLKKISKLEQSDLKERFPDAAYIFHRNPCLSLKELEQFEAEYEISLPTDYKQFLNKIGNGGFRVLPLSRFPGGENFPANSFHLLRHPFPYRSAWEEESFEEFITLYHAPNFFIGDYVDMKAVRSSYKKLHKKALSQQLSLFDVDAFYEGEAFKDRVRNKLVISGGSFCCVIPLWQI